MKVLSAIFAFAMLWTSAATAKPKKWSQHEAIAEAQHDIRANNVKFYWHGGYASMPVGLPAKYAHIADRYPHAGGGIGCIVDDRAVRERQREYSETYNKLMLSYVLHKD
ncbi:MAG: hypothetical protein WA849_12120 [Candidatus Udaeobacter sp.]